MIVLLRLTTLLWLVLTAVASCLLVACLYMCYNNKLMSSGDIWTTRRDPGFNTCYVDVTRPLVLTS